MITKYATVELQVHTVSELNRMNLKLHGKESLSVTCHFCALLQKRTGISYENLKNTFIVNWHD